jgi:hypothetical protein
MVMTTHWTEVSPSSWVKHRTAVAEWWKTCRKAAGGRADGRQRATLTRRVSSVRGGDAPSGFFLRTRKTVSSSS